MKPDTYISVWFDDVSDDHGWIVDRCDDDNNSQTVRCYEVTQDDDDVYDATEYSEGGKKALKFAKEYSAKTGLPIKIISAK